MHTVSPSWYQQQLTPEFAMQDPPEPTIEDRLLFLQEYIENVADDVAVLTYLMQEQTKNISSLVSLVEEALVVAPPDDEIWSLPIQ